MEWVLLQPRCWVVLNVWFTTNGMCAKNNTTYTVRKSNNSDHGMWTLLLLAATVWSFAHMLLGLSDHNKMVLWPGCEGCARCRLHKKNVRSVQFVVKTRGCCCSLCWHCIECAIHYERDVREEQHRYICGANKQYHCLAALDLGAGVEQLFNCPEPSGHAVHEEADGLDIGGQHGQWFLFFYTTLRGCRGSHTPFVQAGVEMSDTGAEAVKPDPGCSCEGHSISREVGAGVGDENAESCGVVCLLHIPLVIRLVHRTYVVVRWTDELCSGYKWVFRFKSCHWHHNLSLHYCRPGIKLNSMSRRWTYFICFEILILRQVCFSKG